MILRLLFVLALVSSAISASSEDDPSCRRRLFDLIFVIDGSLSVSKINFETIKDYVKDFVDLYHVDPEWTRVAVVQYGSIIREEISLGQYHDKESLKDAISDIVFMEGGTMTGRALRHVATTMLNDNDPNRSVRSKTKVILLTDGRSQDSRYGTVTKYQQVIKNYGAELYVVAVGRNVNETELVEIASKPTSKYLHRYDKFGSIRLDSLEIGEDVECEKLVPAPINLKFSPVGVTSAHASWQLPRDIEDVYLAVQSYNTSYRRADKRGGWRHSQVVDEEVDLENLKPDTRYQYKVFAISQGDRTSLTVGGEFTTARYGRTSIKLFEPTSHSLVARWVVSDGDGVTGYKLRYAKYLDNSTLDPNFKTKSRKLDADVSEFTIDGLEPNTYYDSWVLPLYGSVEGKLADHYGLKTTKLVPKVENLMVVDATPQRASFTWELTSDDDDVYEHVRYYDLKWWRVGARRKTQQKQVRNTAYTIGKLREGTEYMMSVAAVSSSGETSQPSTLAFNTSRYGDTRLRLGRARSDSFNARWSVENSQQVTAYQLTYYPTENRDQAKTMTLGANTKKTTIRSLQADTLYSVELTPKIGADNGKTVTKQISTASLGAVTVRQVASTVRSITLRWEGTKTRGLTGYQIRYLDPNTNQESTISVERGVKQQTLFDLQPGVTYQVTVTPLYGEQQGTSVTKEMTTDQPGDVYLRTGVAKVTSMKVRWNMEDDDENEITNYELKIRRADVNDETSEDEVRTFMFESTVHEKNIKKLEPETEYVIELTPMFGEIRGETVTEREVTASKGRAELHVEGAGDGAIRATWSVDDGEGLQGYLLTYYESSDGSVKKRLYRLDASTTEKTITGLLPGTQYTVEVIPTYRRYTGVTSKKSIITSGTPPADIENVQIEQQSEDSVRVSWEDSNRRNNSEYNVSWKVKKTKTYNKQSTPETQLVVEDLTPEAEYVFKVEGVGEDGTKSKPAKKFFATNLASGSGSGSNSNSETSITTTTEVITVVKTTTTTVTVSWNGLKDEGTTNFKVTHFETGQGEETAETSMFDSETTETTLEGLNPNSEYQVEITSMHGEEEGDSFTQTVETDRQEIPQPSNMLVNLTSGSSAEVEWETTVMSEEHQRINYFLVKLWRTNFPGYELEEEISDPALTLESLKEDSVYTISVEAVAEDGEKSEPLVESFETKSRENLELATTRRSARSIDIEWQAEDDSDLSGFELEYHALNETLLEFPHVKALDASARNWTIEMLQPDTQYTIKITPFYNGIAGNTVEMQSSTNEYLGSRVVDLTADIISHTTALASWNVENELEGTEYRVKVTSEYDESMQLELLTANQSILLDGLQPYLDYTLDVAAVTPGFENDLFAETTTFNTAIASKLVTSEDGNLEVTDRSAHTLTIRWNQSEDEQVESYLLQYLPVVEGEEGEAQTLELASDVTLAVLNNLTPNTDYEVSLTPLLEDGQQLDTVTVNDYTDALKQPRMDSLRVDVTSPVSANVEWQLVGDVTDGYEEVEHYDVTYRAHQNRGPQIRETTKETNFDLTHLLVNQQYTVAVDAFTQSGLKLNTLKTTFVTAKPGDIEIEADEITKNGMLIRWEIENDESVSKYLLNYYQADRLEDAGSAIPVQGRVHERRLYRLKPNTTYTIEVTPVFGFEEGPTSTIDATTSAFGPTVTTITNVTSSTAEVTWQVDRQAISHIDHFTVSLATDEDDTYLREKTVPGDARFAVLDDLKSGTEYKARVTAYSADSVRVSESEHQRFTTAAEEQQKLVIDVNDITFTTAHVAWQPSTQADPSKSIKYEVSYTDRSDDSFTTETTDNEVDLELLSPGTEYSVSVVSYTNGVRGQAAHHQFKTVELLPVEMTRVEATTDSLEFGWEVALDGLVKRFEVEVEEDSSDSEPSSMELNAETRDLTVEGLRPNTDYTITVVPIYEDRNMNTLEGLPTTVQQSTNSLVPYVEELGVSHAAHTNANITWQLHTGDDYESVLRYDIVLTDQDNGVTDTVHSAAEDTTATLENLNPSTLYTVRVFAVSQTNQQNPTQDEATLSKTHASVEFLTYSLGETTVQVLDSSSKSIYVKWTTDNTDGLTAYSMTVTSVTTNETLDELAEIFLPQQTSYLLTDLDPFTTYKVEVTPLFEGINGTAGSAQLSTDKIMPELGSVEVSDVTQLSATLTWEVLGEGDPLFHDVEDVVYMVNRLGSEEDAQEFTTKKTSAILQLEPATEYEYSVYLRTKTNESDSIVGTFETLRFGEVNITSVESDLNSIQVEWSHDDSSITHYELSYHDQNDKTGERKIIIQDGNTSSYLLEGLLPNTVYQLQLTPIHSSSAFVGLPVSTTVQTEKLIPRIRVLNVNRITPFSAQLIWNVAVMNDSYDEVDHFDVKYLDVSADGDVEERIARDGDTSYYLDDLKPDSAYQASVQIVTAGSATSDEKLIEFTTSALSEPVLELSEPEQTSIHANWRMEGEDDGLTGYELSYRQLGTDDDADDEENLESVQLTSIDDEFTADKLQVNRNYEFALTPLYSAHRGLKTTRQMRTKKHIPSLTEVEVSEVTDVTALVTWNVTGADDADFENIRSVVVNYWPVGDEEQAMKYVTLGEQREAQLEALEANTDYEVTVRLKNEDSGYSPRQRLTLKTAPLRKLTVGSVEVEEDSIVIGFEVERRDELDHVTVSYSDVTQEDDVVKEVTVAKGVGSARLEQLTPGATYQVELKPIYTTVVGAAQEFSATTKRRIPELSNFKVVNLTQVDGLLTWEVDGSGKQFANLPKYALQLIREGHAPENYQLEDARFTLSNLRSEENYVAKVHGIAPDERKTSTSSLSFTTPAYGSTYGQVSNITVSAFTLEFDSTDDAKGLTDFEIKLRKVSHDDQESSEEMRGLRVAADSCTTCEKRFSNLEAASEYLVSITPIYFERIKGETIEVPVSTERKIPRVGELMFDDITHTSFNMTWQVDSGDEYDDVTQFIIRVYNEGYGSTENNYRPETFYIYPSNPDFVSKSHVVNNLPPSLNYTVTLLALTNGGYTNKLSADVATESYSNIAFDIAEVTPTSMLVNWISSGGTGLTSYKFTYYPTECLSASDYHQSCAKMSMYESLDADVTSKQLTSLLPGEEYAVVIRPIHGDVKGPEFEHRQIIPRRLPETINFEVSDVGHETATFSWDVRGSGKEYEDVEEYRITIRVRNDTGGDDTLHSASSMGGRERFYQVKDLEEGTEYYVDLEGKTAEEDLPMLTTSFKTNDMGTLELGFDQIGNSSFRAKWELTGGEDVSGYRLKYTHRTDELLDRKEPVYWTEALNFPNCTTDYTVTGLSPGTLHVVKVISIYGDLSEGEGVEAEVKTKKLQPRASNLRVSRVNLTSSRIEWQMTDDSRDFNHVTHYEVVAELVKRNGQQVDDVTSGHHTFDTTTETSFDLQNLEPNSTYKVYVSAISNQSDFSMPVTTTLNTGVIGSTNIEVTSQKHSSIATTWSRAPGLYLTKYRLTVARDNFDQDVIQTHYIAENIVSFNVKDLEADSKYLLELTPIYGWLEGKPATKRVATTKVPVRVHKLRIVENGYTSAVLSWNVEAPADFLKSNDYEFQLNYYDRSDPSQKQKEAFVRGAKNYTFTDLRPDTSYSVNIRALNVDEKKPIPSHTFTTKSIGYFDATPVNVSSNEVFFTWRTSSLDLDDLEEIDVAVQEYGGIEVKRHLKITPDANPFKIDRLQPGTTYAFDFTQKIRDLPEGHFTKGNSYRMRETTTRLVPGIKAVKYDELSRTAATARWTLEDDKGPYVDDIFFVLKLRVVPTDQVVKMFQHDENEYMLTGLWPDTEYELNITVVSQFGRAEEFTSRFTTEPTDAMELVLTNPTKYSLTAKWNPPEGLDVHNYELHYAEAPDPSVADPATSIPNDQFIVQRFSGERRQFTMNDLKPGQFYFVKVFPMHSTLRGTPGSASLSTNKIFPHPRRIDSYNIGLYRASVKWDMEPLPGSMGAAAISHYILNLTVASSSSSSLMTSSGDEDEISPTRRSIDDGIFVTKDTNYTFTNLHPFTRYRVSILPVTSQKVDEEDTALFSPPSITFYTHATGQHDMTVEHSSGDLNISWRSFNADHLTDYRLAVYGPFDHQPQFDEADYFEWKENQEAHVTMMDKIVTSFTHPDVDYFTWYVVELTPVFAQEDAPPVVQQIEIVPTDEKLMPVLDTRVMNVTHSSATIKWNVTEGEYFFPVKHHISLRYQPVDNPERATTMHTQLASTRTEFLEKLESDTDYEYRMWFTTNNITVAAEGNFTTLAQTSLEISVVDFNITAIRVKWVTNNLDDLVTGYLLRYKMVGETEGSEQTPFKSMTFDRDTNSASLRNLEPNTHHQIRVVPLYGDTRGTNEVITYAWTAPLLRPILRATRLLNSRIRISWRNPNTRFPVDGHVVRVTPTKLGNGSENARVIRMENQKGNTITLKRLMGVAYDVSALSFVLYDDPLPTRFSPNATLTVQPITLIKPIWVKVAEQGPHSVKFVARTMGYDAQAKCVPVSEEGGQTREAKVLSRLEKTRVVMICQNLTAGTVYRIVTKLVDGNHTGPARVIKAKTVAIAPINFKLSQTTTKPSTSLQASWRVPRPNKNDSSQIDYHLSYYPANADPSLAKRIVVPGGRRRKYSYVLEDLIPDQTYHATVYAQSSQGPKSHKVRTTKATQPEVIVLKLNASGDDFAQLKWNPTVYSDADGYELTISPTDRERGVIYSIPPNRTSYNVDLSPDHDHYEARIRVIYDSGNPRRISQQFGLTAITWVGLDHVTNRSADLVWRLVNETSSVATSFYVSFKRGFESRLQRYDDQIKTQKLHLEDLQPNEEYSLDVGVVYHKLLSAPLYTTFTTDSNPLNGSTPSIVSNDEDESCSCSQMRSTQNRLWSKINEQAQIIVELTRQLEEYKAAAAEKKIQSSGRRRISNDFNSNKPQEASSGDGN